MIYLNHKHFEKIAGPITSSLKGIVEGLLGRTERAIVKDRITTTARSKAQERVDNPDKFRKHAKLQPMPKVDKTGLSKAKSTTLDDTESHSLRRAIERSKNPKKVLTEVRKSTEPIYAGGNTAANMRGVIRSQEKQVREKSKKTFGKTNPRIKKFSLY